MPANKHCKRRLVPPLDEALQQLAVGHASTLVRVRKLAYKANQSV
jgi:hypothetical protein